MPHVLARTVLLGPRLDVAERHESAFGGSQVHRLEVGLRYAHGNDRAVAWRPPDGWPRDPSVAVSRIGRGLRAGPTRPDPVRARSAFRWRRRAARWSSSIRLESARRASFSLVIGAAAGASCGTSAGAAVPHRVRRVPRRNLESRAHGAPTVRTPSNQFTDTTTWIAETASPLSGEGRVDSSPCSYSRAAGPVVDHQEHGADSAGPLPSPSANSALRWRNRRSRRIPLARKNLFARLSRRTHLATSRRAALRVAAGGVAGHVRRIGDRPSAPPPHV